MNTTPEIFALIIGVFLGEFLSVGMLLFMAWVLKWHAKETTVIQDYCKGFMMRDETVESCGRVLRTDGRCDNAGKHVPAPRKAKKDEQTGSGS